MGTTIDAKRNIRLTSKKDGLGWASSPKYCSEIILLKMCTLYIVGRRNTQRR